MLPSTQWIFAVAVVFGSFAFVLSDWQSFRVTWGQDINDQSKFAKLPTTENDARRWRYSKLPGNCSGGKFLGHRYMRGLDPAVILIFDVNGYIAGVQNGIPRKYMDKVNTTVNFKKTPAYQLDKIMNEDVYFLTAYFIEPDTICTTGRSKQQYEKQKVGTGLYYQNGSDPIRDSEEVPFVEAYMDGSGWVKGKYVKAMGVHYWYETDKDMVCKYFFPFATNYNEGAIASFNFATFGDYTFSKRFEHPHSDELVDFFDPVPKCMYEEMKSSGGFTCMHIFFSVDPWNC